MNYGQHEEPVCGDLSGLKGTQGDIAEQQRQLDLSTFAMNLLHSARNPGKDAAQAQNLSAAGFPEVEIVMNTENDASHKINYGHFSVLDLPEEYLSGGRNRQGGSF